MIFILTGDIHTGKTTALKNWSENQEDVFGILSPLDEQGKRYFLTLPQQQKIVMEVPKSSINSISIGPYYFSKLGFEQAEKHIDEQLNQINHGIVIIDELGKLELKNKGLVFSIKNAIASSYVQDELHIVLVIRKTLLNEAINYFELDEYEVLTIENINKLDNFTFRNKKIRDESR